MKDDENFLFSDDVLESLSTQQLRHVFTHLHKNNDELRKQVQQLTDMYRREQEVFQTIVQSQQVWTSKHLFDTTLYTFVLILTTLSSHFRPPS